MLHRQLLFKFFFHFLRKSQIRDGTKNPSKHQPTMKAKKKQIIFITCKGRLIFGQKIKILINAKRTRHKKLTTKSRFPKLQK